MDSKFAETCLFLNYAIDFFSQYLGHRASNNAFCASDLIPFGEKLDLLPAIAKILEVLLVTSRVSGTHHPDFGVKSSNFRTN